jgi:hypothetical protein
MRLSDLVASLVARYEGTDDLMRETGRRWYPDALAKCEEIGAGLIPVPIVARVMSILSPRVKWDWCIRWTRDIVVAHLEGEVMPAVSTGANRTKAWSELNGKPAISGQKVSAFVRAILGDTDAVVIDSWTLRTVGLKPDAKVTANRQRWITAAYTEAAAIVGESPRDLQAILWCAIRGSHE